MTKKDLTKVIEGEVLGVQSLQKQLDDTEAELMNIEAFQKFIELRKTVNDKMAEIRKNIADVMIPAYQAGEVDKTVKGDWGSVTVTESDQFDIDEQTLPKKFWKTVVDTTKVRDTYHLEGKAPKGVTHAGKKYGITTKFK